MFHSKWNLLFLYLFLCSKYNPTLFFILSLGHHVWVECALSMLTSFLSWVIVRWLYTSVFIYSFWSFLFMSFCYNKKEHLPQDRTKIRKWNHNLYCQYVEHLVIKSSLNKGLRQHCASSSVTWSVKTSLVHNQRKESQWRDGTEASSGVTTTSMCWTGWNVIT